jgi:hypothetical protein
MQLQTMLQLLNKRYNLLHSFTEDFDFDIAMLKSPPLRTFKEMKRLAVVSCEDFLG